MTSLLPWLPMPHQPALDCPQCGALALHDYLLSTERDPGGYPWRSFLLHIPSRFRRRKARPLLTRLLKRQLTTASR
ncbi:hypothetical protein [Pseudomonas sp. 910_21]|uniref:hypothetical protein n=1 Tax=Pseudomonas sp. 910_21 TaxID=2604460 RepID=UPI004062D0C0